MNWLKKHLATVLLTVVFVIGLCLLLYPTISDYWNSFHQSRAIASYAETVADLNEVDYKAMLKAAKRYNKKLLSRTGEWILNDKETKEYNRLLNLSETGIMAYVEVPKIRCTLPIYHGTSEGVLQIAIGHIPGSSLPVGGKSTHCVLSGHRGLPRAKLFSDLDQLVEGDLFMIRVLDETLTYEVDQILIVEPDDLSALEIEEGKDLCTLVTCTPYGVNTHRLLVRGHRVKNVEDSDNIRVTADAMQIEPIVVAPLVAVPMLLILLLWMFISTRKAKEKKKKGGEDDD